MKVLKGLGLSQYWLRGIRAASHADTLRVSVVATLGAPAPTLRRLRTVQ
jgi:hypothetical protein